ncbi:MAG: Maf family nucleotide pyrophosphatase [Bacteroidia bacterium]|nr:Maf family nucleotide pyrophosphatase [Bacteroidia bacterium]
MKTSHKLILASQSPRRQQLLREMGFTFEVVVRPSEEIVPENLSPQEVAISIAKTKAEKYPDLSWDHIVITADTIVVFEGEILGKPTSRQDALRMLRNLSGVTHSVISGVTLLHKEKFYCFAEETKVTFRPLTEPEMGYYTDRYQPYDKAGAYGIQEWIGMIGVSAIEGDFYNVMGLPAGKLYTHLKQLTQIEL